MVCLITVNNFTIALEAGIPRNSHNFNGMGQILPDIGMTPLKFNGYRNIPLFFTGYRNGEGGLKPPLSGTIHPLGATIGGWTIF